MQHADRYRNTKCCWLSDCHTFTQILWANLFMKYYLCWIIYSVLFCCFTCAAATRKKKQKNFTKPRSMQYTFCAYTLDREREKHQWDVFQFVDRINISDCNNRDKMNASRMQHHIPAICLFSVCIHGHDADSVCCSNFNEFMQNLVSVRCRIDFLLH